MDGNGGAPKPMEAGESKQGGAKEEVKERERCREQSPAGGKCDDGDSSQQPPHVPIVPQQVKTETDAVGKSAETHATTNVNDEHVLSSLPESARVDIDTSTHKPRVGVASDTHPSNPTEDALVNEALSPAKAEEVRIEKERVNVEDGGEMLEEEFRNAQPPKSKIAAEADARHEVRTRSLKPRIPWETRYDDGDESGTEEEQHVFRKEVEAFYRERSLEFKAPKFYKEELNLLKLYRAVIKLGGYEQVTSCKLWRQVGAPFRPPKTCTTVSWTFRNFYEKALLEYEKYRMQCGEVHFIEHPIADSKIENQVGGSHPNQALTSGRALRDAAARAMQGWQSHGFGNPEDGKSSFSPKSDKHMRSSGLLKRKKTSVNENTAHLARTKATKPQLSSIVVDIGPPADWVKINVYKINDCFEVYALVPGLLREEVHVQSDPAGRLIISGQPQQMDNPWGVTPFKKVVSLPSRIDPLQTSAVVTLNGQLFVRVPFEQKDL